jgi:hypothetical protein
MVDTTPVFETAPAPTKPAQTVTSQILRFLGKRLKEGSTLRGILLLTTSAGVYLSPEQQEAIIAIGLGLAGLIGVLFPDAEAP